MNIPESDRPRDPIGVTVDGVRRVAVVGGGMMGMATAYRLTQYGFSVTLLEEATQPGGLARSSRIGPVTWDRFYHVILQSDSHLLSLLRELSLDSRTRWSTTRTGFFAGGQLYSLSNSLEFLRFPILSLVDKTRLAFTILAASRTEHNPDLENTLVTQWLLRLSGPRLVEKIWLPLLRSKLGENYKIANAAFIWATIRRMYAARRSGYKEEKFGYVEGGYQTIIARLQAHLDSSGVITRLGQKVTRVINTSGRVLVENADGTSDSFDAVVLTVPTIAVAKICPQLTEQEAERLSSVVYQGIVCPSVLLRRPLAGFYVTNIIDAWVPFTGVIEMTALVNEESLGGNSLVYLPKYLTQDSSYWGMSDAEIRSEFLSALEKMYRGLTRDDVLHCEVARARKVIAVPTLGYSRHLLPQIQTSVSGVYVLNSAQIPHGTLNVNETLGLIEGRLPELLSHLRSSGSIEKE